MEESTGLSERRARSVTTIVLIGLAVWVFLFKYLPLDAGLWALQAELVRNHMTGHLGDGVKAIPFPVANMGAPFITAIMTSFMSGEIAVRILMTLGAIFIRGFGMVLLFRALHVRDIAVYFLIPVLVMSGIWFTGALPYLMAETVAFYVLAFFVSQDRPHGSAYWAISLGLLLVAFFHALVFVLLIVVILMIMREQSRSVHLSQGWLSQPRTVISLLFPGAMLVILGLIAGEPIFRLTSSALVPDGLRRSIFLMTPAPDVLEATFRYGDILHGLLAILFAAVILGCFARAYLLAIEEVTWQSRALRTAGYFLILLALLGPVTAGTLGIETSSGLILATVLVLAGSYSRGPAVRRTPADRLIYTGALIALIASIAMNAFSIAAGSAAASDVLKASRQLVVGERQTALEDEHRDKISVRFVLDSALVAQEEARLIGRFSYSMTAPIYLFSEHDLLARPAAFQPRGGMVHTDQGVAISPAIRAMLGTEDRYVDSSARVLAALHDSTSTTPTFGPYALTLAANAGRMIDIGQARYRLAIGRLEAGHHIEMALSEPRLR